MKDLQPMLDYFDMLMTYEQKGFLEVIPDKHEAYITRAAFFTLSDNISSQTDEILMSEAVKGLPITERRLKSLVYLKGYAGFKSKQVNDYLKEPFAIHLVKEDKPHDLLCTILILYRRVWQKLWLSKAPTLEVITYDNNKSVNGKW